MKKTPKTILKLIVYVVGIPLFLIILLIIGSYQAERKELLNDLETELWDGKGFPDSFSLDDYISKELLFLPYRGWHVQFRIDQADFWKLVERYKAEIIVLEKDGLPNESYYRFSPQLVMLEEKNKTSELGIILYKLTDEGKITTGTSSFDPTNQNVCSAVIDTESSPTLSVSLYLPTRYPVK